MAKERAMDVLVSEHVMGHQVIRPKSGAIKERTVLGHIRPLRAYSTDIGACWEVIQKLKITLLPIQPDSWFALVGEAWNGPAQFFEFLQKADFTSSGAAVDKSAPLAVCVAALKAVEKRTGYAILTEVEARPEAVTHTPPPGLPH